MFKVWLVWMDLFKFEMLSCFVYWLGNGRIELLGSEELIMLGNPFLPGFLRS